MNNTYLVTGGAGFIGSNLVDALINQGDNVIVLDNLSTGQRSYINQKATFVMGDICTYDFSTLGKIDGIFHLAAQSRIYPSILDPEGSNFVNVHGTVRVLEYARKVSAKIVFSSSSSVYGMQKNLPAREDSPPDVRSPYALQKLMCDHYFDLFHRLYNLRYAIVRYFNVYGERQIFAGPYATVVGIFLHQFINGMPFSIIGDGSQRRDFTYVGDAVRATILAMLNSADVGLYNIGTGLNYSIWEVTDLISKEHPRVYLPLRPGDYRETKADNSNAKKILGWQPKVVLARWIQSQLTRTENPEYIQDENETQPSLYKNQTAIVRPGVS